MTIYFFRGNNRENDTGRQQHHKRTKPDALTEKSDAHPANLMGQLDLFAHVVTLAHRNQETLPALGWSLYRGGRGPVPGGRMLYEPITRM